METRYTTPDGIFTLLIQKEADDVTIGFAGLPWHTHLGIVAGLRGTEPDDQALQDYLADIFEDRLPIVVLTKAGLIQEPYIPDFPGAPVSTKYFSPDESYFVRCWTKPEKA